MDREKILTELLGKSSGKCMRCGKELSKEIAVIDHIFPRKYGGSDHIENLRVVCNKCNNLSVNRFSLKESEFQQYIQQLLLADTRFHNIFVDKQIETIDGQRITADILFSRTVHGREESYIIEAKSSLAITKQGIESAIHQLKYYQRALPSLHFILAVSTPIAEEYRSCVYNSGFTLWDSEVFRAGIPDKEIPITLEKDIYDELIDKLCDCQPGYHNWQVYQKLVGEILSALFCPPLDAISEQNSDANRANRRDFVIPNYADCGYWPRLRQRYKAEFLVVDAKNSAEAIEKDDILQVAHYLKEKGPGLFALIFSRRGMDESAEKHLQDIWINEDKMIIILNDSDVEQMLLSKQAGADPCRLLIDKIQEFRLRI